MNETLAIIHKRKSLRTYADTPISDRDKELIISSAIRAPTAGNMMLYSILEVSRSAEENTTGQNLRQSTIYRSGSARPAFYGGYAEMVRLL